MGAILAELLGRENGILKGKGGSMHLTSVKHGMMGSYAVIGAHLCIANGAAWSAQMRGTDQVTVCFFGDGTTNIGAFHEALNLAKIWDLPTVSCARTTCIWSTRRSTSLAYTGVRWGEMAATLLLSRGPPAPHARCPEKRGNSTCGGGNSGSASTTVPAETTTVTQPTTTTVGAPSSTAELGTVFSWGDDLTEWVTDEEMKAALHDLFGVDGEVWVELGETPGSAQDIQLHGNLVWHVGEWEVAAHNADHDGDGVVDAELTKTDPRLPPGVVYEAAWGFAHGDYLLSGPNSPEAICMTVWDGVHLVPDPEDAEEVEAHEDRVFAVATMMLKEMGWTD